MYRFFEEKNSKIDNEIILNSDNLKHLEVLRIGLNEEFEVVIDGLVYLVKIKEKFKDFAKLYIISEYNENHESNILINLYQGLPKSDKFEWIVQKSVELGVNKIIPFTSSRTIVKWDEKKSNKKIERYNEIVKSASKQSKRTSIPKVESLISFKDMLKNLRNKFIIFAYEGDGDSLRYVLTKNKVSEVNIIVGPEGGFSKEEVDEFIEIGANIVSLGNRILRTETAAIALTAMIQYELGDINI